MTRWEWEVAEVVNDDGGRVEWEVTQVVRTIGGTTLL